MAGEVYHGHFEFTREQAQVLPIIPNNGKWAFPARQSASARGEVRLDGDGIVHFGSPASEPIGTFQEMEGEARMTEIKARSYWSDAATLGMGGVLVSNIRRKPYRIDNCNRTGCRYLPDLTPPNDERVGRYPGSLRSARTALRTEFLGMNSGNDGALRKSFPHSARSGRLQCA